MSVLTHGHLFHTLIITSLLPYFIAPIVLLFAIDRSFHWLPWPFGISLSLWVIYLLICTLTFWHYKLLQAHLGYFLPHLWETTISTRSCGSFCWKLRLEIKTSKIKINPDPDTRCAHYCWSIDSSSPSHMTMETCVCTDMGMHISVSLSVCNSPVYVEVDRSFCWCLQFLPLASWVLQGSCWCVAFHSSNESPGSHDLSVIDLIV